MRLFQGVLPFKLVVVEEELSNVTSHAGLPSAVEALRAALPRNGYRRLRRALRYKSWQPVRRHVESLVLLMAEGGDHVSDIEVLRSDAGLIRLLGFKPSSASQLKDFLYRFHQAASGQTLTPEEDAALSVKGKATIRPEGPGLRSLALLNDELVRVVQRDRKCSRATLDIDATIIEAHKRAALKAYEGTIGYQPQMAWWAEQSLWVADQFRDGNVPAEFEARAFLERAFSALPGSVTQRRLRGDSALYNEDALSWADDQGIDFAVSADMSQSLAEIVRALPEDGWQPYPTLRRDGSEHPMPSEERQWAEVPGFVPEWKRNRKKDGEPFRYIAIRVRSRQRDLLEDDETRWRHFAVVTNMKWAGQRLLRWQREKQGTVEHGHDIMKRELAGGTLPCGRFGANAAWWRLNALVHNLLQIIKIRDLPAGMAHLRPKALRFRLFNIPGLLVQTARRLELRVSSAHPWAEVLGRIRESLLDLERAARAGPAMAA